jgi:hypothetical protein
VQTATAQWVCACLLHRVQLVGRYAQHVNPTQHTSAVAVSIPARQGPGVPLNDYNNVCGSRQTVCAQNISLLSGENQDTRYVLLAGGN